MTDFKGRKEEFDNLTTENGKAANGDANHSKVSGEAFRGLGREEVLEKSKEPLWVGLRWAILIIFWLIWIVLLGGAIYLVATAGKCKPPVDVAKTAAAYRVDPRFYATNPDTEKGDLVTMKEKIDAIAELGVKNLILSPLVVGGEKGLQVDENVGGITALKDLVSKANAVGLRVVAGVDMNSLQVGGTDSLFNGNDKLSLFLSKSGNCDGDWTDINGTCFLKDGNETAELDLKSPAARNLITREISRIIKAAGLDGVLISRVDKLVESVSDDESLVYNASDAVPLLTAVKAELSKRSSNTLLMVEMSYEEYDDPNAAEAFIKTLIDDAGVDLYIEPVYSRKPVASEQSFKTMATTPSAWQSRIWGTDNANRLLHSLIMRIFLTGFAPRMPVFVSYDDYDSINDGYYTVCDYAEKEKCSRDDRNGALQASLQFDPAGGQPNRQAIMQILAIREASPAFYDSFAQFKLLNYSDSFTELAYEVSHEDWDDFVVALNLNSANVTLTDLGVSDPTAYFKRCQVVTDAFQCFESQTPLAADASVVSKSAVLLQKLPEQ